MHYLYGSINQGHAICPLYGGCPLFGESAIRGFTVVPSHNNITTDVNAPGREHASWVSYLQSLPLLDSPELSLDHQWGGSHWRRNG